MSPTGTDCRVTSCDGVVGTSDTSYIEQDPGLDVENTGVSTSGQDSGLAVTNSGVLNIGQDTGLAAENCGES